MLRVTPRALRARNTLFGSPVPAIRRTEEWRARARGPDQERAEGCGPSPHDVLYHLTLRLKELRDRVPRPAGVLTRRQSFCTIPLDE